MELRMILQGDCLDVLKTLPDASVQCCVTSPPYYGLRDYGTGTWEGGDPECNHNPQKPDGGERAGRTLPLGRGGIYRDVCTKCGAVRIDNQIGLEQTPDDYVAKLVEVFQEVKRVLKDDGTLWLNLGDSYFSDTKGCGGHSDKQDSNIGSRYEKIKFPRNGLKPKDLIGIPWRVAFALQADGWWLRQDIIWHKPNPMPESVKDRCTKAHEYVFLLTKSARCYYDAASIYEPANYDGRKDTVFKGSVKFNGNTIARVGGERWPKRLYPDGPNQTLHDHKHSGYFKEDGTELFRRDGDGLPARNKRSVWTITTQPYKEAHFAVMPEKLVEPCILAGSKTGDIVLDPFSGAGTVAVVAVKNRRNYIGIELNPDYVEMSKRRIEKVSQQMSIGECDGTA